MSKEGGKDVAHVVWKNPENPDPANAHTVWWKRIDFECVICRFDEKTQKYTTDCDTKRLNDTQSSKFTIDNSGSKYRITVTSIGMFFVTNDEDWNLYGGSIDFIFTSTKEQEGNGILTLVIALLVVKFELHENIFLFSAA